MTGKNEQLNKFLDMAEHFYLRKEYNKNNQSESAFRTGNNSNSGSMIISEQDSLNSEQLLNSVADEVRQCRQCSLCEQRTNAVPGTGVLNPELIVIGEAPGAGEDKQGLPFVGKAGQYLDKWLEAIEMSREKNVFIANIIKCRPPGNRDPLPEECDTCSPYLVRQIEILKPKVILALGRIAAQYLLKTQTGITRLRGKVFYYNNIPLIPTFHPAAVLRNPEYRKEVWSDLKLLREQL